MGRGGDGVRHGRHGDGNGDGDGEEGAGEREMCPRSKAMAADFVELLVAAGAVDSGSLLRYTIGQRLR